MNIREFTIHGSFIVRYGKSGAQILVRPECEAAGQKRIGRWGSAPSLRFWHKTFLAAKCMEYAERVEVTIATM